MESSKDQHALVCVAGDLLWMLREQIWGWEARVEVGRPIKESLQK